MPDGKPSFLFLAADTPWVYSLASNLASGHATTCVWFTDWLNLRRRQPEWPPRQHNPGIRHVMAAMPPGYASTYEPLVRPFMRFAISAWQADLSRRSGAVPYVICQYPYLAPWVRGVSRDRLIYYNLDDYTLYNPAKASQTAALEAELITRAELVLCIADYQARRIRSLYPAQADRIIHFPLGVVDAFINPEPMKPPEPRSVGYVGNLSDRVDWKFVYRVAVACRDLTFLFVGSLSADGGDGSRWQSDRDAAFSLPNVRHVSQVRQEDVGPLYWSFAVNWIPYDVTHPFNRASCPTKIMDGLASGRPVVSTAVPECELYSDTICIVRSVEDAACQLRRFNDGVATEVKDKQLRMVRAFTWPHRSEDFVSLLQRIEQCS